VGAEPREFDGHRGADATAGAGQRYAAGDTASLPLSV
jgi:hypothetical protein